MNRETAFLALAVALAAVALVATGLSLAGVFDTAHHHARCTAQPLWEGQHYHPLCPRAA